MLNRLHTTKHSSLRLVKTHRRSQCHILPLIKSRRRVARNIATAYSGMFPSCSRYTGTQYMPSLSSKNIFEERLSVVAENTHELKLLGVPAYQPGTHRNVSDIQANLTVDLLSLRKCCGSVVNMT